VKELRIPDLNLIKQAEQGCRDANGRFRKGGSGDPNGRSTGARNKATEAAETSYFERRLRELEEAHASRA
jgi:hypothetical protein